ncbi:sodium:glutamate symporter [Photobacterium iliopiscarium]|jgi:ESS family glutamate:Na+ symporter|uniref:Sodium/glutamate symporter n=1 Tax=Photobacterium iliopiscarium TaxID=56192 RepID=A0A0D8P661_9GAMM|nr:sodium/glutamate symporter [Photobacterium iliopiscarium]KJG14140.1 sodium:glutamate symporter [Photobacterium iliopiscarium]KJG19481.1 sodium:glutamate symporter [Photobacterium iliopiscarium]PST94021.1 sodium/glutamate symporter [Photobacterium iliopiscarium]PSU00666.1 sodium/glutamate symporter [Photobacterium iliopiscarium]PSV82352.1 sodium/glutamate symporter [Photobacterium iliopiscarium]
MTTAIHVNELESLLIAIIVLFLGYFINTKVKILRQYNIPEPIVGGLVIAFIITFFHFQGFDISFKLTMQDTLMQMFFATVGLAASYKLLMKGGSRVFLFLGIATVFIIIQDAVGVGMSKALGLDPLLGLIVGSITLSGGHGTGAAWSQTFATDYGLNTLELSMAAATFGLIMGGIIGGPIAQRLINKHKLKSDFGESGNHHIEHPDLITYSDREEDRITSKNTIEVLFILLACVAGASHFKDFIDGLGISALRIPEFVYALFIGVFITNICEGTKCYKINKETVDALGTISLSLFLAMALMSLHLWELMDLAMPMLIILAVQTLVLGLFTYFVTFRVMGSNYDAAIIAGGHCGFGMGATPTAVMNMGSLVSRNGPSPQAFMVVPIVGAFFIDITNLIVLQGYISFLGH